MSPNKKLSDFLGRFDAMAAAVPTMSLKLPVGVTVDVRREDLIHPKVSGNKWRKLKYNVITAADKGCDALLTFGGPHSNHIAATASAGEWLGMPTVGIIRGEELAKKRSDFGNENPTLHYAENVGMQLEFISREAYRKKHEEAYLAELKARFPRAYIIPEGGTNQLGVKGAEEILTDADRKQYDLICVAGGTGGTAAGIIRSSSEVQKTIVFSALKGTFLKQEISQFTEREDYKVVSEDRFGGYARSDDSLIRFMNSCFRESGIPLDPIYTGKMMFRLNQMLEHGVIPRESRILAIHTGGLQGLPAYNRLLVKKGRQTIDYAHRFE